MDSSVDMVARMMMDDEEEDSHQIYDENYREAHDVVDLRRPSPEPGERRKDDKDKPKRIIKRNPIATLNPARLCGPRGLSDLQNHFKDFKFKGKGHETSDLDAVMTKLEHWAYRLFPKFRFDDTIAQVEKLGDKKAVRVHAKRIRMGMTEAELENDIQREGAGTVVASISAEEPPPPQEDPFEEILREHEAELAQAPAMDTDDIDEDMLREIEEAANRLTRDAQQALANGLSDESSQEIPNTSEIITTPAAATEDTSGSERSTAAMTREEPEP
ncbi:unnamed protein product [Cyprideis torosa]|uniref:TIMELESS-interacting protein n=1 Tax=Cyprideis torosa TaxID=163714 RepID=A0A7R8ZTF0_9CRUS|nr:unnamed protein product [Cyprideis torosa]CAG0907477.1 unnamed protein product [Cyprideis torosa]